MEAKRGGVDFQELQGIQVQCHCRSKGCWPVTERATVGDKGLAGLSSGEGTVSGRSADDGR